MEPHKLIEAIERATPPDGPSRYYSVKRTTEWNLNGAPGASQPSSSSPDTYGELRSGTSRGGQTERVAALVFDGDEVTGLVINPDVQARWAWPVYEAAQRAGLPVQ